MPKGTVIDICKADATGVIEVRMRKYNEDGSWSYHRTTVTPGVDPAAQMEMVNTGIERRNAKAVSERATFGGGRPQDYFDHIEEHALLTEAEIAKVVSLSRQVHTPEMVKAYKDKQVKLP